MGSIDKTVEYYLDDFNKSLFPLETNRVVIENAAKELSDYIYQKILNDEEKEHNFLPQVRCYASKHGMHFRRTLKLDPVAEFFIYDLVYRNRVSFIKDFGTRRKSFGHRFEAGKPIPLSKAYREFKKAVASANVEFKYGVKLDIASYFNSLYHHDIVKWFDDGRRSEKDADYLGKFLRQINSGRSVDCLPHGIHPCKVIGAEFLKFVDNSSRLKSELMLRFMDDIYFFSNKQINLDWDFVLIQQLLGDKGLSVNAAKSKFENVALAEVEHDIEKVRKQLLHFRTTMIEHYDGFEEQVVVDELRLESEHEEYLMHLLKLPDVDDTDAELILTFMGERGEDVVEYLSTFLEKFPNLSKKIYYFCEKIEDKSGLAAVVESFLGEKEVVTEEQLFWLAKIAEDFLLETDKYSELLIMLYEHPSATSISKAKILEIPESRFGMPDLREQHLRVGKADWLSWASAVGSRALTKRNRNHLLGYFSNVAQINFLIAECIKRL